MNPEMKPDSALRPGRAIRLRGSRSGERFRSTGSGMARAPAAGATRRSAVGSAAARDVGVRGRVSRTRSLRNPRRPRAARSLRQRSPRARDHRRAAATVVRRGAASQGGLRPRLRRRRGALPRGRSVKRPECGLIRLRRGAAVHVPRAVAGVPEVPPAPPPPPSPGEGVLQELLLREPLQRALSGHGATRS